MRSLWSDQKAKSFAKDALAMRVYTSRLLGQESALVLHGGGNTSVKMQVKDLFGDQQDVLCVKGSGWDLATIEKEGFAPVKMDALLKMADMKRLSDTDMVKGQRAAMLNPYAPNPSVEAILHAIIPFKFVDHTHADAVVTVSNTPNGLKHMQAIYGDDVLIIPYVMPGFLLAKYIYDQTRNMDWSKIKGLILMHHGVFSFSDDAKMSYENMIKLVTRAEKFLKAKKALVRPVGKRAKKDLLALSALRKQVSWNRGGAVLAQSNDSPMAVHFSLQKKLADVASRGPLTPDHIIRIKRTPAVLDDKGQGVGKFVKAYASYFKKYGSKDQTCLDPAPRWAVWPAQGVVAFGQTVKENVIIQDILDHTMPAILSAEKLGGWVALPERDLFEMEYWELEQAKLKSSSKVSDYLGKSVLVTGAASGIGKACVDAFVQAGAAVTAVDIDPYVVSVFKGQSQVLAVKADLTKEGDIVRCVEAAVEWVGGLDIVVSNAGMFPSSASIQDMPSGIWDKSFQLNVTAHQRLLTAVVPYLRNGMSPAVVIVGSKNVPAPGPGAAAYSSAKAALTQLARVAALEWGEYGIRVNTVHPNQVFDTAIWTSDVLKKRAAHYDLSVEDYKTSNVLHTEITSKDVAQLILTMTGPVFAKTTGAQVPIDGGNERVI